VADHILAHAGLADLNTELEQFAVDPRSSPERIVAAHLANQLADVFWNSRSPGLATPDLPGPEQPEALAVPGDHRLRLNDDEGGAPIGPNPGQPCPEKAIGGGQFRPLHRALEDGELVTQGEDLQLKGCTATEDGQHGREQGREQPYRRQSTDSDQPPIYQ
jgi:hypothetical protein